MDGAQFDAVSRFFAQRRLSRRQALAHGGVGLAAGLVATGFAAPADAQGATSAPDSPDAEHGPAMLFVQSFQSGSIAPKEGTDGRYVVTLEHGLGQTIYFSDRPDRIVGATPTPQFLEGLGFPPDNPPNAALIVEGDAGETDFAVVELFDPTYDETTNTATYEVAVLADWERSSDLGVTAAPTDLAAIEPTFGAAHLFIDDCPDGEIRCATSSLDADVRGTIPNAEHDGFCYSWGAASCLPCQPWNSSGSAAHDYWTAQCNQRFPGCNGKCRPFGVCTSGLAADCPDWDFYLGPF